MSAGMNHSYMWLNSHLEPIGLPAHEYITHPSTVSYAHNPALTTASDDCIGKRSGFPEDFASTCRDIFVQMFRVYAHLYWGHFVEPFYHLGLKKQLNSCFNHFLLTATGLDMLKPQDLESMQLLIDLLAVNGSLPSDSKAYKYANLKSGSQLLHLNLLPPVQ